jgi:hypothetical protein
MEQILKDFIDNNEANDAIVGKVTYISLEDVDRLLKKQKIALNQNKEESYSNWDYDEIINKRRNWDNDEIINEEDE